MDWKWHLLNICLTLFQTEIDYLWKRNTLIKHDQQVLSCIILHFFGLKRQIYKKELVDFSFSPFSNSLNMKTIKFSLLLNSLKHQIVTDLSIITRSSFTFARLIKTSHSDGFTWRVGLYIKHMLPSSRLLKNKEVLVNNDWGKWGKE